MNQVYASAAIVFASVTFVWIAILRLSIRVAELERRCGPASKD